MGLRLVIEDIEGATTIVPLEEQEVTIGRKDHNTIQLTEQNVSRSHARLHLEEETWVVEDLHSYNGVKVNGVPGYDEKTPLREGDLIQIGDYHLKLTDDVERETIDLGRPREAANQGVEPIMASSSADLPAMSAAELAASGPAAVAPPSTGTTPVVDDDDVEAQSKAGIFIGIIVGVVILGGGAFYFMNRNVANPGEAAAEMDDAGKAAASAGDPVQEEPREPEPEAETPVGETGVAEEAADTDGAEALDTEGVEAGAPVEGEEPPEEAAPEEAPPEEPAAEETTAAPTKKKKKKKKESGGTPPPPEPEVDTAQLLDEARKASLAGDAAKAYELASKAYKAKHSSKALQLMGVSACKMGSKSKAKAAYKKMSGTKKEALKSLCAQNGIEL